MKGILQKADLTPDTGSLKNTPAQYDFIQNVRGYAGIISKRNGIRNISSVPVGVMGIYDIYRDGDPTSPDRILVLDGAGNLWVYQWSEFTSIVSGFQYVIGQGGSLLQQSPNGTWWSIYPVADNRKFAVKEMAAPATTRTTDLVIHQDELFGSIDGSTTWRFGIDNSFPPNAIASQEYGPMLADTTFSTLAFTSAVGLVFELDTLVRYRVGVANDSAITITEL